MRYITNKNKQKILYCSPFFWKKIFLYHKNPIFKIAEKFIFMRSSIIPKILVGYTIKIHSGKTWHNRIVNKWMVGFKFGEFSWNRKLALYKAKQLKKKKKKNNWNFNNCYKFIDLAGFYTEGR
jgi:ribosomal protein S19